MPKRTYTRWTSIEQDHAKDAVAAKLTARHVLHLFPGRSGQTVRNMLASARREITGVHQCGHPRDTSTGPSTHRCPRCAKTHKLRREQILAQGRCSRCQQPIDPLQVGASITRCATCNVTPAPQVPRTSHSDSWSGLLRWISSGVNKAAVTAAPDNARTIVDLFGGSASFSLLAAAHAPSAKVLYNDIHPTLCQIVHDVARDPLQLARQASQLASSNSDPLLAYRQLPSPAHLVALANVVVGRNMHNPVVETLRPLPRSYTRRLQLAQTLLSPEHVEVRNDDCLHTLQHIPDHPSTYIFLDPPYVGVAPHFEHNISINQFHQIVDFLRHTRARFLLATGSSRAAATALAPLAPNVYLSTAHNNGDSYHIIVVADPLTAARFPMRIQPLQFPRFGIAVHR